ncbi:hypothetical protein NPIL_629781 [Nephila pilipes]|uniref:Uncharacterized protein n=1 Tax=Nephila pilipes TaxID=299642 RepID=A0A8X6QHX7_NEPPI|nr:hypothetical protein NPIL_629781 [Nephila pilipes]
MNLIIKIIGPTDAMHIRYLGPKPTMNWSLDLSINRQAMRIWISNSNKSLHPLGFTETQSYIQNESQSSGFCCCLPGCLMHFDSRRASR